MSSNEAKSDTNTDHFDEHETVVDHSGPSSVSSSVPTTTTTTTTPRDWISRSEKLLHFFGSHKAAGTLRDHQFIAKTFNRCAELFRRDGEILTITNCGQQELCDSYPIHMILHKSYVDHIESIPNGITNGMETVDGGDAVNSDLADIGVSGKSGSFHSDQRGDNLPYSPPLVAHPTNSNSSYSANDDDQMNECQDGVSRLLSIIERARFARVHRRFVVPVIFLPNHSCIARSSTLSTTGELLLNKATSVVSEALLSHRVRVHFETSLVFMYRLTVILFLSHFVILE